MLSVDYPKVIDRNVLISNYCKQCLSVGNLATFRQFAYNGILHYNLYYVK